jgi:predicted ATPase
MRVRVRGLASIDDIELHPGRLTVLIGPNGSGKSNLLRALQLAPLLRSKSLSRFVADAGGASALLHYGPKRTQAIELELEFRQGKRRSLYRARLGFAAGDTLIFLDEVVGHDDGEDEGSGFLERSLGAGHRESVLKDVKDEDPGIRAVNYWLSQLSFFHFHDTSMASALRTHARAADDRFLRSDGSNLAAYLLRLAESESEADMKAWRRIGRLVRTVNPGIKELLPTRVGRNGDAVRLDWIDDRDERFGVHQLSDGSLRAIALITALAQPTERLPRFISIDEPELGLHPAAIALLAELARSVSHRTQVLFATQSTAFLDHFRPDEVVVTEREEGVTRLKRLDTADLREWLDEYALSEIFDKGIIGGRP